MNQAGEGGKAGAMILNEKLQREALPCRNSLRVPGKQSWVYSLQGVFIRSKVLLCSVLFSLEMGFRRDAWIQISPFWVDPHWILDPHCSDMNSQCDWGGV